MALLKEKKAQTSLYFAFMMAAITIVVIAAVFAPMGVRFNSEMYIAGQGILNESLPTINQINDADVKAAVLDSVNAARDEGSNIIQVNAAVFQYSWVVIIALLALIVFLSARRLVEYGQGGII